MLLKEKELNNDLYYIEFESIIKDILDNDTVKKMKDYKQHYDTSCYEHCKNVSYYSYLICKKYNLDFISAARARNVT